MMMMMKMTKMTNHKLSNHSDLRLLQERQQALRKRTTMAMVKVELMILRIN